MRHGVAMHCCSASVFLAFFQSGNADTPESMRHQNSVKTQSVTNRDHGTELHFRVGDGLTLRLEASPGTGYSWQVSGYDASMLTQIGNSAYEELRSPVLGGATHELFHFSIKSPGVSRLELEYRRPWEKPNRATKAFSITVIAQE
jgi:predicted secreted protein